MRIAVGDVKMPVTPNSSTPIRQFVSGVRIVERAFEHHRRAAGNQRRVDHVAVADDPADVRGRPPDVVRLQPEAPPAHADDVDLIAAVGVDRQLRLGGRARGGEDVRRLRSPPSARSRCPDSPPPRGMRPTSRRGRDASGPAASVRWSTMTRSTPAVDRSSASSTISFNRTFLPLRQVASAVKTSRDPLAWIRSASAFAPKPGKNHRVDRADAHRRQHQHDRLGARRHVDGQAIALANAEATQRRGHPLHAVEQLGVGEDRAVAAFVEVDERRVTAAAVADVMIQRVVGEVGLRADKPAERRRVPLEDAIPAPEPGQLARPRAPRSPRGRAARPGSSAGRLGNERHGLESRSAR